MLWNSRLIVYRFPLFVIIGYVLLATSSARCGGIGPWPANRTIELFGCCPPRHPAPEGVVGTVAQVLLPVVVVGGGALTGHIDLLAVAAGVAYLVLIAVVCALALRGESRL